jgi:hypothetical protein
MKPENARRLALARIASPTTGPSCRSVRHLVRFGAGPSPVPGPPCLGGGPGGRLLR